MSIFSLLPPRAHATEGFDPTRADACETTGWAKLERLSDSAPELIQEPFIPLLERAGELAAAFGGARPRSSLVLLHYAAGWDRATDTPPVVLVHGAGVDATASFADQPFGQPFEGLAARLARAERRVFAVTFAHPHGDNLLQAEALANAIARVRHVTNAKQVDLVAHSKGGMAARIYLSGAGPSWATPYRGDVRRYVMLGTPNRGIDVTFAYPNLGYWILENKTPAPVAWTEALYWGRWIDLREQVLTAPAFAGQPQMLWRWDARYGRTRAKGQWDIDATYDGGRGKVSVGPGIDRAIAQGGHLIERLRKLPLPAEVELCALAGQTPWLAGLVGERRGPSDGLVLVESALDLEPMTKKGARVVRRDLRRLNHLQIVYHPLGNDWAVDALAAP